jgi:hypothetical protein
LQPLGDNNTLRPETSRITLEGAEISISGAAGGPGAAPFTSRFSGTIYPDDSEDPGLAVVEVPIPLYGLGLASGQYDISIVAFGTSHGGLNVESSAFVFPLTVLDAGLTGVCASADLEELAFHPCYPKYIQDGSPFVCEQLGSTAGACASCTP